MRYADYTVVWNSLDYPVLAFPVTAVDPMLDLPKPAHAFLSQEDKKNFELCRESFRHNLLSLTPLPDTPETFKYAPVGLQLVGRTQEEEALVRMGEIVDDVLKHHAKL